MLNVQVQYLNYLETKRHDLATEDISNRTLAEQKRSNLVRENQTQQQINESIQHNRTTEAIGYMQAAAAQSQAETSRMLANAQIPLITAQAITAKEEAKQAKIKTYFATDYQAAKLAEQEQKAETARLEAENYTSLQYMKAIGSIIPF